MGVVSNYMPDVRVEIAFDSGVATPAASRTWTDVSDYLELQQEINITRGRQDERSTVEPSSLSLTLDNRDGRFTPGNASSPYYPNVKLGRPIRVAVNLLANGNFETDVSGWSGGNAALAQVTSPTYAGSGAMRLTRIGAGDMSAGTPTGVSGIPVTPSSWYATSAWFRAATTGRSCQVRMRFYDAGGSLISTVLSTAVTDTTSGWTEAYLNVQAPTAAAFASLGCLVTAPGASEQHYVDLAFYGAARFTGYVDEWPVEWPNEIDAIAHAPLVASSRLARLGEGAELRSIIETEIMQDNPVAYYPLGEPEGSLYAQEFTGHDQIGMYSYYGGAGITFGTGTGPRTDGLPAVQLDPTLSGEQHIMLAAYFDQPISAVTLEVFAAFNWRNVGEVANLISLYSNVNTTGDYTQVNINGVSVPVAGDTIVLLQSSVTEKISGTTSFLNANVVGTATFAGGTHHHALTYVPGATPTLKYYFDGVLQITTTLPTGTLLTSLPAYHYLVLGPVEVTSGDQPYTLAHAAVYGSALSDARIAAHADAGLTGFNDETAGERIERYAGYIGIDLNEVVADDGVAGIAHIDTTNATAESLLRIVEATEGGVLYDDRDGNLIFRDRDHRYQTTAAFTLNAALQEVESDGLRPQLDRSTIMNSVTATNTAGSLEQRFEDTSAIDDYGLRRGDVQVASDDVDQVYQAAASRVNWYKDPRPRIASLSPVDVLHLSSATRTAIAGADISSKFTVSNLPSQAPETSPSFFVEGITETLSPESWRFSFNVSASDIYEDIWILADATHGQLGTTTILAY